MENKDSNEREFLVDIEIGEADQESSSNRAPLINKCGKKSLNKLVSGVLGFNDSNAEFSNEATGFLTEEYQGNVEKKKPEKLKKASKPPRPPRGPTLDASDMRLIKEISKIAMRKRERVERIKVMKKMRAAKMESSASLSLSVSSAIAMVITVLFFLVLILQGLSTSSNMGTTGAPQQAPETTRGLGLEPVQSYDTALSDDGAAPSFLLPPEFTR